MKRTTSNRLWLLALLAVVILLFAAVFSATKWRERTSDTLELSFSDNITTLDPALIKDVAGGRLAALLYPTLVKYDKSEKIAGDLAAAWDISPDALVYTFHLRPDMRFADGSPITATDVSASFHRALSPAVSSPRAWVLAPIKGAAEFRRGDADSIAGLRVIDDTTLAITLEEPSATFISLLTMPSASVLPRSTTPKPMWGTEVLPVAGGPYLVNRLEPDVSMELRANPQYYGAPPTMERIRYRIIKNPFAAVSEFRQGRLDIMEIPDAFDLYFSDDPAWRPYIDSVEGLNTFYLGFNCTRAPFTDRDFRRAICMAIDRVSIIDSVLHGKATPAAGPIPPGLSGYDGKLTGLPYDPERAREVITAMPPGRTLSILTLSNSDTITIVHTIAGQLRAAGLPVEVAGRERGTFKALLADGDFDMVYYSWVADYASGENFLEPLFATSATRSTGNYTAYSNPEVDSLLARARKTPDTASRSALYVRTSAIVVEDAPRAFLWHARRVTVRQPWVIGFSPARIYNAQRFEGVYIDDRLFAEDPRR